MPTPEEDLLASRVATVLDIPLHRFVGLQLLDEHRPQDGIVFEVGDATVNNAKVLHGGIVTALLDVACYLSLLPVLGADEHAVTHDLSASLVRSVPYGARVQVQGTVVRKGRSLVFLRAEATVDGDVVASAQVTKSVLRARPA